MLDRFLGLASVLSFAVGAAAAPPGPAAETVLTFADRAVVESSGLVAAGDGLFVTTNDSGDGGRIFVVDHSGRTVGTTTWSPEPVDVEALAPAVPGEVWVGDIGDNPGARDSIRVLRVPFGREHRAVEPVSYELVYPDGARDAETLLAHPRTGRLLVVSKDIFGGVVYAAPRRLSSERPNRLRPVADGFAFATDGSFFPDGRHYVVRGYAGASIYTYPGHERVGSFPLPDQQQGEGIAVGPDDELYLSTEGQHSELLRMPVPTRIAAAMEPRPEPSPASPSATGGGVEPVEVAPPEADTPWGWVGGGGLALAFAAGLGWLLIRRGQAS